MRFIFSVQAQDLTYGQLLDTIIPIAFSFQTAYNSSSTASIFYNAEGIPFLEFTSLL